MVSTGELMTEFLKYLAAGVQLVFVARSESFVKYFTTNTLNKIS